MFAITGITGQVGSAVARTLTSVHAAFRPIVRDLAKAEPWTSQGIRSAVADMTDADSLAKAFEDAQGVFVMIPPYFAPRPGYPEARAVIAALKQALRSTSPGRIVCLSSVGAHQNRGLGLITQLHIMEQELSTLNSPIAFVRAAWFMENARWDIPQAIKTGTLATCLSPLEHPIPVIATDDVGRVGANVLRQTWTGRRNIELEAARRATPYDFAFALTKALHRPVNPIAIPREQWPAVFHQIGSDADTVQPRIEMIEGFNSGWIDFERDARCEPETGEITLDEALTKLADATSPQLT